MVITIEEVEIAHLERVQFGLKNFDMVFVFKDFTRPPYHVNTIPVEFLDQVKDYLDSSDIAYTEGPLNLNWPTIMKTVTADTHQFFADGGWSFLQADSDDDGGEESDQESAFEMDEEEFDEESESSDEGSDFGSNASDDEDEDAELDSEDEGEDWDELERKAKKRDRESAMEEEDRGDKKKKQRKR
jgi:nucleosome binding factor SPN SPT16 subunit